MRKWLSFNHLFYYLYFAISICFYEIVLRAFVKISGFPFFAIMFSISIAIILGFICTILPKLPGKIVAFVFSLIITAGYAVQLVYCHIYGSFASITQIGMSKDVMNTFGGAAMIGIKESVIAIIILFLPIIALIVLSILHFPKERMEFNYKYYLAGFGAFIVFHFFVVLLLPLGGKKAYSPYDTYHDTFVISNSEKQFGVLTTLRIELQSIIFGRKDNSKLEVVEIPEVVIKTTPTPVATSTPEPTKAPNATPTPSPSPTPSPTPFVTHDMGIDFKQLAKDESKEEIKNLHTYFSEDKPDLGNEYTGMFEGYNLILICAESFSDRIIDEELTPTLYKLTHEGFVFTDFYNSINDNTSNAEFTLLMGILPDSSLYNRGWDAFADYNSFTVSKNNDTRFCLANQLNKLGYNSYAFHNFWGSFYGRENTHPNMGYDFKYFYHGLDYSGDCPTSDASMMNQSIKTIIQRDEDGNVIPFHAYYLTFSGHMPYNFNYGNGEYFSGNSMAIKNKAMVDGLDYSYATKAYLAGQLELEYALRDLIDNLDNEGVLEKTVICLVADHYPYSLGMGGVEELAGEKLDREFDSYKSSMILWNSEMETVEVDTTCCTLDVLPTLSNLFGLDYDSRLLMGKDIFAEGDHAAILFDRSFVTKYIKYNINTNEVEKRMDVDLPDGYSDAWIQKIKDKFKISSMILFNDYYKYLQK